MKLELLNNDPFSSPTPGQSFSDVPQQWQWEQPAQIVNPTEAFEKVYESLQDPIVSETTIKLMYIGVSIETILNGVMLKMFGEGVFSPDVAELIKPFLTRYLLKVANDNGIDVNIVNKFAKPPISDEDTLTLLKKFRPKEYTKVFNEINEKQNNTKQDEQIQGFMTPRGEE
tara:strand:+ start:411 stop:923 length:513 start_codon:yes stop_codon:yes gene_type:complete